MYINGELIEIAATAVSSFIGECDDSLVRNSEEATL